MKTLFLKVTSLILPPIAVLSFLFFAVSSCKKNSETVSDPGPAIAGKDPKTLKDFTQVNLVGSNNEYSPSRIDPLLVNGWGIAFSTFGTIWVSAEVTGVSTVYNKDGNQVLAAVSIPSHSSSTGGHPTGQTFYSGIGFRLTNGNPARFIFAGDDGIISGWNGGANAVKKVDDSLDAAYFGITIAKDGNDEFLYAANFAEKKIDVYDTSWAEVSKPFTDPGLPGDYSPFNIQNIAGNLYVMYAQVGPGGDEVHSPGRGIVDIYRADGSLIKRFVSNGQLNSPWGVAKAPPGFWGDEAISDAILIGNFGDGRINAYDQNGNFLGQLRKSGNPIVIEGLWGIAFPPASATSVNPNHLYFAAGPGDETEGLFGYISK